MVAKVCAWDGIWSPALSPIVQRLLHRIGGGIAHCPIAHLDSFVGFGRPVVMVMVMCVDTETSVCLLVSERSSLQANRTKERK
jgi:hypothetical protein